MKRKRRPAKKTALDKPAVKMPGECLNTFTNGVCMHGCTEDAEHDPPCICDCGFEWNPEEAD